MTRQERNEVDSVNLSHILEIADRLFPFHLAESWDNCGIQIGDPRRALRSIAFSLDATPETVRKAADHGCGLLVTHHPLMLEPLRNITPDTLTGKTILCAAGLDVAIVSLHTNLDAAEGGLNDALARRLGFEDIVTPLRAPCARLGRLPGRIPLHALAEMVARTLDIPHVRLVAEHESEIERVFCASGSGMGYLKQAVESGAEAMITGDVRYHAAREAQSAGMPVIDAGHFGLEKIAPRVMADALGAELRQLGVTVPCVPFDTETEPFQYIVGKEGVYGERSTTTS